MKRNYLAANEFARLLALNFLCWTALNMALFASEPRFIGRHPQSGLSLAAIVENQPLLHTAQLLPINEAGSPATPDDPVQQTKQIARHIRSALASVGAEFNDLVRLNLYLSQADHLEKVLATLRAELGSARPTWTLVESPLPDPKALVGADLVAIARRPPADSSRLLTIAGLPKVRAMAQAGILPVGSALYVSGQAERGELIEATRLTMESLMKTVAHSGLKPADIVQLKAFMLPMSKAEAVREEVGRFFPNQAVPPLVFVEWKSTLPIEIELIAAAGPLNAAEPVSYLTPPGMTASPLYSRAARVDSSRVIYFSSLTGTDSSGAGDQIQEIFEKLRGLLVQAGSDFRHLVKATYYVADDESSRLLNQLRPNYYDPHRPPAASKAMVRGVVWPEKSIAVDMIAVPLP